MLIKLKHGDFLGRGTRSISFVIWLQQNDFTYGIVAISGEGGGTQLSLPFFIGSATGKKPLIILYNRFSFCFPGMILWSTMNQSYILNCNDVFTNWHNVLYVVFLLILHWNLFYRVTIVWNQVHKDLPHQTQFTDFLF